MCVGDNLCVYQREHKASVIRVEVYGGVELGVFAQYSLALHYCEEKRSKCNIEINKKMDIGIRRTAVYEGVSC